MKTGNRQGDEAERELLWEGEPVLRLQLLPAALPPDVPRRAAAYCRRVEENWRRRWEGSYFRRAAAAAERARGASRPFVPWTASYTARTTAAEGLLWINWEAAEEAGGRRCLVRGSHGWSLPGGAPAELGDYFPGIRRWRRIVLKQAAEELRQRQESGDYGLYADWERRLPRAFRPDRFRRTEEGLELWFPMCALAPWWEGTPTVSIISPGEESR